MADELLGLCAVSHRRGCQGGQRKPAFPKDSMPHFHTHCEMEDDVLVCEPSCTSSWQMSCPEGPSKTLPADVENLPHIRYNDREMGIAQIGLGRMFGYLRNVY